jgi:hypothetical protein
MSSRRARRSAADQTVHGVDRMVRNVQTGRFERGLSALTAAMALLKGDPNKWGVLKEGLMTKAREILPGG